MPAQKPLAIDLFCGLGGWTDGLLAEGWDVIGFDVERHCYPKFHGVSDGGTKTPGNNSSPKWADRPIARLKDAKGEEINGEWQEYPGQLVLQDVLTLHGSQFKNCGLIVCSPPCQEYSYRAMPWKRAKALPPPSNELFDACFRIQREACEAAGRHIPMVVENVKGAQPWVGRAKWHYGSFYLWGDVPALMPFAKHRKVPGMNFHEHEKTGMPGRSFQSAAVESTGVKHGGAWFSGYGGGFGWDHSQMRQHSSKSPARKAASAQIAKIPLPLSQWIARVYHPEPSLSLPTAPESDNFQELCQSSIN